MRFVRLGFLCLFAVGSTLQASPKPPDPVNPHASPEARALLAYLYSISGHAIITGQHSFTRDGAKWSDLAYQITGKYPGLFGADLGFAGGDDKIPS